MKANINQVGFEARIDELLPVLDKDIHYLEYSLAQLNELRRLVITQQVDGLRKLLENIRNQINDYQGNHKRRHNICEKIACFFNCKPDEITLTWLEAKLNGEKNNQIATRKRKLQLLAATLKKEHAATQFLLADCARFNRTLLNNIFRNNRSENVTYNTNGTSERQTDNVFVNLKL